MESKPSTHLLTGIFAIVSLIFVLAACSWFDNRNNRNGQSDNKYNPTPSPTISPSPVTADRLRRYQDNVRAGERDKEPLPLLEDVAWHNIPPGTLVQPDENGEGWLDLQGCMRIYVFQKSKAVTAPCSKAEFTSGHTNCLLAGTAVYNNSCEPRAELLIQTPTAELTPHGTWFSVTYMPDQQLTFVMVLDGTVSVKPITDAATHSLGEPTAIGPGKAWFTVPDNRLKEDRAYAGSERQVRTVNEFQDIVRGLVGPWMDRIQERAKQDGIAVPTLEPPPSPSPTPTEMNAEDIDCDCQNIRAGVLRRVYLRQCLQVEANLRSQFKEAKRVVGKCDPVASGPNARPK